MNTRRRWPQVLAREAVLLGALAALALSAQETPAESASPTRYGHRAYPEAPEAELRPVGEYRGTGRVVRLHVPAAEAFDRMSAAARENGVHLVPISGFRSRDYQVTLFTRMTRRRGSEERAAQWVAPPGYSEHHTGRALDLGDRRRGQCDLQRCFEGTPAFRWLDQRRASSASSSPSPAAAASPPRRAGPATSPALALRRRRRQP